MKDTFRIVRILDEYRIIINAGSLSGVTNNHYFKIIGIVDSIYDPETNELLGTINGEKTRVKPIEIFDKMCICSSVSTINPWLSLTETLQKSLAFYPIKLNVDKSQISNPELYTPIQVGDNAVLCINLTSSIPETEDIETIKESDTPKL